MGTVQFGFNAKKLKLNRLYKTKTKPNQTIYELSSHLNQNHLGKTWNQTEQSNQNKH